ncbi:MAG: zinc ABC transporter substrate-binding protein [Parachlamydiaceae bacterium]|nr:zinc ABC transporter substrate-binding protein [Parachlamydiaceae bacterium]
MKKTLSLILSFFLIWGCSTSERQSQSWAAGEDRIKVLSTIAMIEDLVKAIGGETVAALTLIRGELDPHSYQLVKGDDEKLAMADIIFCSGLGLEHGPSLRESLVMSSKAVCLGDEIYQTDPSVILFLQKTPDPHIWMDISLWAKGIPFIVSALSKQNPEQADFYKQNGEALTKKMMESHLILQQEMAKIPEEKRYLVTSHDAFNYFTRAYLSTEKERAEGGWEKRFVAPEGLAPESQLSSTDIRLILTHIKEYNINVIFSESNVSHASIVKLLDSGNEEGLHLIIAKGPLYGDAMGPPGSPGDSYLKMIHHDVFTIIKYLDHTDVANGK